MHAIHITILPTGVSDIEPLCITVPRPATQVSYDICKEIQKLLDGYTAALKTTYTNHKQYWVMRANQNNKMKVKFEIRPYVLREIFKHFNEGKYD